MRLSLRCRGQVRLLIDHYQRRSPGTVTEAQVVEKAVAELFEREELTAPDNIEELGG